MTKNIGPELGNSINDLATAQLSFFYKLLFSKSHPKVYIVFIVLLYD